MPWHVVEGHSECPSARPWAVVKDTDGDVEGCHETKSDAQDQLAALNIAENKTKADDREDYWTWPGGAVRVSGLPPDRQQTYDEQRRRYLED